MLRKLLAALAVIAVAGCATKYGDPGLLGGVKVTPQDSGIYLVEAGGNGYTSPARVRAFALLKAAETTLENGATHFEIVKATDKTSRQQLYTSGGVINVRKPGLELAIALHTGPASEPSVQLLDAQQVVGKIRPALEDAGAIAKKAETD